MVLPVTLIDEELDRKLRAMVITLRKAVPVINIRVIRGVLMGLLSTFMLFVVY